MSNNFQRGDQSPATFTPAGGQLTTLNIKGKSGDHDCLLFDVTHTGHGGHTARIAGKDDFKATVNADLDLDAPPYAAPPNIRPGTTGILQYFLGPTKFIQIPVIVSKLHFEDTVESEVKYSFDVAMNVLAGIMVYPAA